LEFGRISTVSKLRAMAVEESFFTDRRSPHRRSVIVLNTLNVWPRTHILEVQEQENYDLEDGDTADVLLNKRIRLTFSELALKDSTVTPQPSVLLNVDDERVGGYKYYNTSSEEGKIPSANETFMARSGGMHASRHWRTVDISQ